MADKKKLRTLVLSVDIGAGHRMAAESLCEAIGLEYPGSEWKLLEALSYLGPGGGKMAKDLYFGALKEAPDLWGTLYAQKGLFDLFRPINELADDFRLGKLGPDARAFAPDVILAMHPIACGLASSLARKREVSCPIVAVLTDFDAHPAWVYQGIDLYLTPSLEVAQAMRARGLPSGEVVATGLPIRAGFSQTLDKQSARKRLGLAENRFTVLLLGGGLGLGPIAETAEALTALGGLSSELQLVILAGRNEELERSARAVAARSKIPVHVTGMVNNVWDYAAAADVAIGKPGGMTCAELLALGVPLIALAPIPGQEQANGDALVRLEAAVHAPVAEAARAWVRDLIEKPALLSKMRAAALRLGRPHAALEAALKVMDLVKAKGKTEGPSRPAPTSPLRGAEDAIERELAAIKRKLGF